MFDKFKEIPNKLIKREEKWLLGEYSYLPRLKKAIDSRDKKTVKAIFRRLSRYELRLEKYHKRVLGSLGKVKEKASGEYLEKVSKLLYDSRVFEAELERDLSRYGASELSILIEQENWEELGKLYPKIEQAIQGWVAIDKRLVDFEKEVYERGDTNAELVFALVREIEENPEKAKYPAMIQKIIDLTSKSNELRKRVIERLKVILRRIRITFKTIVWVIFIRAIIGLLSENDQHITMERIENIVGRDFYQVWSSQLPAQQKNEIVDKYISANKPIIDDELNKLLRVCAEDVYNSIIDEIYASSQRTSYELSKKGVSASVSKSLVEHEFLSSVGKSRGEVIEAIHFTLNQYYRCDILIEHLPGFSDGLRAIFQGDIGGLWNSLRWGAFEPNFKIKAEDRIRRQVNTFLEPYLNQLKHDIKQHIKNKLIPIDVVAQFGNLLKTTIMHPSQIGNALNQILAEIARTGLTYIFFIGFVLIVGLLVPGTKTIYRIFIRNYFKDIIDEIRYITHKKSKR
jgi:hypothetical protein